MPLRSRLALGKSWMRSYSCLLGGDITLNSLQDELNAELDALGEEELQRQILEPAAPPATVPASAAAISSTAQSAPAAAVATPDLPPAPTGLPFALDSNAPCFALFVCLAPPRASREEEELRSLEAALGV